MKSFAQDPWTTGVESVQAGAAERSGALTVSEIPVVRDFLDNCTASTIAAFAGVFALSLVVFALFTPLFSSIADRAPIDSTSSPQK